MWLLPTETEIVALANRLGQRKGVVSVGCDGQLGNSPASGQLLCSALCRLHQAGCAIVAPVMWLGRIDSIQITAGGGAVWGKTTSHQGLLTDIEGEIAHSLVGCAAEQQAGKILTQHPAVLETFARDLLQKLL